MQTGETLPRSNTITENYHEQLRKPNPCRYPSFGFGPRHNPFDGSRDNYDADHDRDLITLPHNSPSPFLPGRMPPDPGASPPKASGFSSIETEQ